MESTLHFFKTIRRQLRELSQKIMSDRDYAQYLHQELQWEHDQDEKMVSLQNIQLQRLQIHVLKDTAANVEQPITPSKIQTIPNKIQNIKTQNIETQESVSNTKHTILPHSQISLENSVENIHIQEEDSLAQMFTQVKELDAPSHDNTSQNSELEDTTQPNEVSKPFHMNIHEAIPKKRRRSIFRTKRVVANNLPITNIETKNIETQRKDALSFSDGVRNIISQIETKNIETKKTLSLEQTSENLNSIPSNDDVVFPKDLLDVPLLEQDIHTELKNEANLLDVDILDLQMDLFQDLPPPIPEYFDQQESKENVSFADVEHSFQEDIQVPLPIQDTPIHVSYPDSDSDDNILDDILGRDADPIPNIQDSQQKELHTIEDCSNMLVSNITDSQRQDIFLQRLELHLQQHHWLESCSDAVQIIKMNQILETQIHHLIKAYNMPDLFEHLIFPIPPENS